MRWTSPPLAVEALGEVDHLFNSRLRRRAHALAVNIEAGRFFYDSDLQDLTLLLEPITAAIERRWVTEIISGEHCMSGSWFNHRFTNEAEELRQISAPLLALHRALMQVHNVLLADQAIARMLQNSMG
ncbi:hypothetical protein [Sulfitobacter sp.]|uniref:hypothetical protein n=1 Tax=Sulfitobacter sp. TaxID=1903071 RepID=UPI0030018404